MRALTTLAELDALLKEPGPTLLFKHSTRCPISAGALEEMEAFGGEFVYLDLIAHRDVSNEIARRLGVQHESPQLILVKGGRAAAVLNHDEIQRSAVLGLVAK